MRSRVLVMAIALAAMTTSASAHAFLERLTPGAGDNVHAGPMKVKLSFSEALEPSFSGIKVTDASGHDMSAGPASVDGTEMDLPLKRLLPGRYRVSWHAVSTDTHRSEGKYNFLVLP